MSKQSERARMKKRIQKRQKRKDALRPRYDLYLDKSKSEDALVADKIEKLIDRKKFHPTARRGILIVDELNNGEMSKLLEHYPWIQDKIIAMQPPPAPPDTSELERKIEMLQDMMLRITSGNANTLQNRPAQISLPIPDDTDSLVIRKDENAGANTSDNFLNAAFGFNPAPKPAGGIKQMKLPPIAAPIFDDEEDDIEIRH